MNIHRGSDFNDFLIEQGLTNTDQPMTTTPTPRTDEAADRFPQPGQPPGAQWPEIVPAEFARWLERGLAVERALADSLAETLANVQGDYASTGAITMQEVAESLAAWKECRK